MMYMYLINFDARKKWIVIKRFSPSVIEIRLQDTWPCGQFIHIKFTGVICDPFGSWYKIDLDRSSYNLRVITRDVPVLSRFLASIHAVWQEHLAPEEIRTCNIWIQSLMLFSRTMTKCLRLDPVGNNKINRSNTRHSAKYATIYLSTFHLDFTIVLNTPSTSVMVYKYSSKLKKTHDQKNIKCEWFENLFRHLFQ